MTVKVVKAEPHHLSLAFRDLSKQTAAEIRCSEYGVKATRKNLDIQVERGEAFASLENDQVLTVFGFNDYGEYLSMWTVATERMFGLGVRGVLKTRRFFRNLNFDKPLLVVTTSPHEDVERWLTLLGFEKQRSDGATHVFKYKQ